MQHTAVQAMRVFYGYLHRSWTVNSSPAIYDNLAARAARVTEAAAIVSFSL